MVSNKRWIDIRNILFYLVIGLVFLILLLNEVDKRADTNTTSWILGFCTILTAVGGVWAGVGIYIQLKKSKDLTEAKFLLDLNTNFITNKEITDLYKKLEKSNLKNEDVFLDDDKVKMTYYLTYFELISRLVENNILSIQVVNDLFAYRFFLIMHNKFIQEREILKDAKYYKDIFRLHHEWVNYRKTHHYEILNEEYSLEKTCPIYYELLNQD